MSGVLKNTLDWASRPYGASSLLRKPVLTMTASPAFTGGVRAQMQMNETLLAIRLPRCCGLRPSSAQSTKRYGRAGCLMPQRLVSSKPELRNFWAKLEHVEASLLYANQRWYNTCSVDQRHQIESRRDFVQDTANSLRPTSTRCGATNGYCAKAMPGDWQNVHIGSNEHGCDPHESWHSRGSFSEPIATIVSRPRAASPA